MTELKWPRGKWRQHAAGGCAFSVWAFGYCRLPIRFMGCLVPIIAKEHASLFKWVKLTREGNRIAQGMQVRSRSLASSTLSCCHFKVWLFSTVWSLFISLLCFHHTLSSLPPLWLTRLLFFCSQTPESWPPLKPTSGVFSSQAHHAQVQQTQWMGHTLPQTVADLFPKVSAAWRWIRNLIQCPESPASFV